MAQVKGGKLYRIDMHIQMRRTNIYTGKELVLCHDQPPWLVIRDRRTRCRAGAPLNCSGNNRLAGPCLSSVLMTNPGRGLPTTGVWVPTQTPGQSTSIQRDKAGDAVMTNDRSAPKTDPRSFQNQFRSKIASAALRSPLRVDLRKANVISSVGLQNISSCPARLRRPLSKRAAART